MTPVMSYALIAVVGWCACGVMAAGVFCAHFQDLYPSQNTSKRYREDLGGGLLFGLMFGPMWLVISIFLSGFVASGWTLRHRNKGRKGNR